MFSARLMESVMAMEILTRLAASSVLAIRAAVPGPATSTSPGLMSW
jgi:hypothetical protein